MSFTPSALAEFILDRIEDGVDARTLLEACEAEGFALETVCDVLTSPGGHFVESDEVEVEALVLWSWDDLLCVLVESFGLPRAREVAAATEVWRDVDVATHHTGVRAGLAAQAAITNEVPIGEAFKLATDETVPSAQAAYLLEQLAWAYPAGEIVSIVDAVSPPQASIIARVMQRRLSPLAAFEVLLDDVAPNDLLLALERFWDVRVDDGATKDILLVTYIRLAREEFRPLEAVRRFAAFRGEPTWWVPILRGEGLKASHAALWLLEDGASNLRIADQLTSSGYSDDEVLSALVENGIGTRKSLATLRDSGWSPRKMVETLSERGTLLPEIRAHLEDLGVPASAQRPLLMAFWEESVVDLVLHQQSAMSALASGEDRGED